MERFVKRHEDRIVGSIAGWDRILFRGNLSAICHVEGLARFLSSQRVYYKDYEKFVRKLSKRVNEHAEQLARTKGRPLIYLASAKTVKEDLVRELIAREQLSEGLVCILSCVEPCRSFDIKKDAAAKALQLVARTRQCKHLYFYYLDPEFGLLHIRLQTWLPLTIQVCLNGREYLARQMLAAGIGFQQADNCFTAIADLPRAQALSDRLTTRRWQPFLDALARRVNPWLDQQGRLVLRPYYWTIRQGEYATDILFRDAASLAAVYPALIDHAIRHFHTADVLRFLGRKALWLNSGEVQTNLARRVEGTRIKHWLHENSIKMYDKQGSVLRVETTINNPKRFRVRRRLRRQGNYQWLPLRKGIADMRRRAQLSRAANERYLEALAVVGVPTPAHQLLDKVSAPVTSGTRRYRALRPISPADSRVFEAVQDGRFLLQGVRNKELRQRLYPEPVDKATERRQSGCVTRSLALLKAHKLIYRVPKTNYYRISKLGHEVMSTATRFRITELALLAA